MAKLQQVFGISTQPILSYVTRAKVDGKLLSAVGDHHHIIVYGSSKQEKTALRQKHIGEDRCEIYRCNPNTIPERIYQHILRAANVRIESAETKTESMKSSAKSGFSLKAIIPWLGEGGLSGDRSSEAMKQGSLTTEFVDVSLSDAQNVATILSTAQFNKFVVLENFHYLPREVQRSLSFDPKTFHEMSIRFIVLGVWREANQLLVLNPDLQDRVAEIPVEPWTEEDFTAVIEAGERELNILVPNTARREFICNSYGNVGMLQEFLKTYCQKNLVLETAAKKAELEGVTTVQNTLETKADDQRGRLLTILEGIAAKSRTDKGEGGGDPLTLPFYLVQVLLTAPISELTDGITRNHLLEKIRALHRRSEKDTIRINDVAHLLKRLPALQVDSASPFLYDDANQQRLRIVDAGLLFALAKVDRRVILDEILDPLGTYDDYGPRDRASAVGGHLDGESQG